VSVVQSTPHLVHHGRQNGLSVQFRRTLGCLARSPPPVSLGDPSSGSGWAFGACVFRRTLTSDPAGKARSSAPWFRAQHIAAVRRLFPPKSHCYSKPTVSSHKPLRTYHPFPALTAQFSKHSPQPLSLPARPHSKPRTQPLHTSTAHTANL
jgi:hypothetical protein